MAERRQRSSVERRQGGRPVDRRDGGAVRRGGGSVKALAGLVLLLALAAGGYFAWQNYQDAQIRMAEEQQAAEAARRAAREAEARRLEEERARVAEAERVRRAAEAERQRQAAETERQRQAALAAKAEAEKAQQPQQQATGSGMTTRNDDAGTAPIGGRAATETPSSRENVMQAERSEPESETGATLRRAREVLAAGDTVSALAIVQPLADEGIAGAQALLGLMHAKGDGAEKDDKRAFELFTAAAEQGDTEGAYLLAHAYLDGLGTRADPVEALAWFMVAAARGHAGAAEERDRGYAELDDSLRVRAESRSRSLPVPIPAGWIADDETGVRVWSPSWYRNGTFKVKIEAETANGLAHGPGKVVLTATLYGRSDRTYEGTFVNGLMLHESLRQAPPAPEDLLEGDALRRPLDPAATGLDSVRALWAEFPLGGMELSACPDQQPHVYAVMASDFAGIEDEAVKHVAVKAVRALLKVCAVDGHTPAWVSLLPADYGTGYERGDPVYRPRMADLQLYGFDQPEDSWSISLRKNYAREAHEKREYVAKQQRQREEREAKRQRETAAAMARGMPDIRGFRLGIRFDQFLAQLAADAVAFEPKLKEGQTMPAFASHEQKVTLRDGATLTAVFASAQNQSQLMILVYEQHLRDGPDADALRQQLYDKYGKPDDEAGGRTWLTWWLKSMLDGEPKGAFLKGRLGIDRDSGQVDFLRLVLNDFNLSRRDEADAYNAKLRAQREAFEKKKSGEVKF